MSSGGTAIKGAPNKGAPATANNISNKKPNKSDSKSDKVDLIPKIQATAEQMQIAKIMDSHRQEDPELPKKIRQVMEITRTSEDQASMALHSKEFDVEQAITYLTEGGSVSLESEWAQVGKKRKGKTPKQKSEAVAAKDGKVAPKDGPAKDKSDKRDARGEKKDFDGGDQPFIGERRNDRGGRGGPGGIRGRGGRPGAGRGGRSDKENEEMKPRMANGPGRGGRGGFVARGGRGGGRTFASRARGDREGDSYNTIDVWENSQAESAREAPMKVDKWGEFPSAEDWDNEEYTGSLADTKVFTPSTQTSQGPTGEKTNGTGPANSTHIQSASNPTAADILKMSANQEAGVTMSSVVQGLTGSAAMNGGGNVQAGQSIDLNMLLPKQNTPNTTGGHSNPGVNLLASLQSSFSNNSNQMVSNQSLPQRNKVQRPRGPASSKIPSSAVEMPDDPVTTSLDVQFGGMDLSSDSTLSFSSVIQGGKPSAASVDTGLMYGAGSAAKLDNFGQGTGSNEKDMKQSGVTPPFQAPVNSQSQGAHQESVKATSATSNINPGIDSLSSLTQAQSKPQQTGNNSYGAAAATANSGSAFVSYGGKPAPGFPAPGFPPVSQNTAGVYGSSNINPGAGGIPPSYGSQQSGYMGNLGYGNQPANPTSQPMVASSQNANVPYGPNSGPNAYHMNSNSGYNTSANSQYGSYGSKIGLNATGTGKDGTDVGGSAPVSTGSSGSAPMGSSVQPGSAASSSSSNSKGSAPTNTTTNATSKMSSTMPPGMVMPPYILSQNAPAVPFYGVQAQMYGYEDNMQFLQRFPPNIGYYGGDGYGVVTPGGVSGRNDPGMQGYSTAADGRFPRTENSSTASPVPSNLQGGNTQQAIYNPGVPYFYNMVPPQGSFPYPHMYQPPMPAATNSSQATHPVPTNHKYPNQVYNNTQYTYDTSQGGPAPDFSKNAYPSGSVGPNTNTGKVAPGSSSGVAQSTDLNSSLYGSKSHNMTKMSSFDKQQGYGSGQGGFSNIGAQPNVLNNMNSGMGFNVYIPQAVHTLPMHQETNNPTRSGPGQQKGKQQYGSGGQYWGSN